MGSSDPTPQTLVTLPPPPCGLISVWSASYMACTTRSKLRCNHGFPRSRHGPYCVTRTLLGTHQQRKHDSAGSSQYQTPLHSKVSKHNLVWNHLSSRKDWRSALSHAIHPGHTKVWIQSDSLGLVRAIVSKTTEESIRNFIGHRNLIPYMLLLFSVFFSFVSREQNGPANCVAKAAFRNINCIWAWA